jgi:hypothetical protein
MRAASLDGRKLTLHPTASAGLSLRAPIDKGKFHDVIAATTPTGCLIMDIRLFGVQVLSKSLKVPLH